ncbi:MAG: DNA methyltransferase [Planctomycetota bacterium]|jgi:SAM-dependent methyltransferase
MVDFRTQHLIEFVEWTSKHITGDEKGESQIFLDRMFQALGQKGLLEVGGHPEFRIRKPKEDGGGIAFADYVWKPVVLIEMKKRGVDLSKHYRQAFDYWIRLVPGRPHYVVLCNFDEFWVYDFENQMDTPVDKVTVEELPCRYGPLAFLFPTNETPIFGNNQEQVTRDAADRLVTCFNKLISRNVDRSLAQRFILQMLIALFAEDIGLLERYIVTRILEDCKEPGDSYDLLGGLFIAMNTPSKTSGGRFKNVDYFDGGVFAQPVCLELYPDEIYQLKKAAKANWSKVRPEIFGTLFEHSLDQEERHAFGAHFTSHVDIMKIINPTIVEPWREQIENAKTLKRLNELLGRMHDYKVLDPACGSGNFLYIAYRELKRLEFRLYERINEMSARQIPGQAAFGLVTARQFYGIDINPFAVELAKVTMMIGRKLAIDELHIDERPLPLDNLDDNFITGDALIHVEGNNPDMPILKANKNPVVTMWPKVDVIIGNPPFLGSKRLKPERGSRYVNAVRKAYSDVPGMADYCVYWLRKTHDHLFECSVDDQVTGRAGLVGTQNIRNNQSRVGGLDYIVKTGTIIEAIDNQPWSGESNVHVSIANWVKTQNSRLLPKKRRLWYKVDQPAIKRKVSKQSKNSATKEYELSYRECDHINSALSHEIDVSIKRPLQCNKSPKRCYQGKIPGYSGFLVDAVTAKQLSVDSSRVIVPYLIGRELLGYFQIKRWAIDFRDMNMIQAATFKSAFNHCKKYILPEIRKKYEETDKEKSDMKEARKQHLNRWWQFWNRRDELNNALSKIKRYVACSRVTRRPIMVFLSSKICPSDLVQVFAFDDDYSFGILQNNAHFEWFRKSSRLKVETDLRYSVRGVFDTFPWPQSPSIKQVKTVAEAGREVRRIRAEILTDIKGGLRAVYRMLELPGKNPLKDAHAALDAAALNAYGFSANKDLLTQLLELNLQIAELIDAGQRVTVPGIPQSYPDPSSLVTDDCICANLNL